MKLIQKHSIRLIMAIFFWLFVSYNHIFIRSDETPLSLENKVWARINTVPYTTYFDVQQEQPSVFFTTPAFPSYTQRCHENKKLCTLIPLQQLYADTQWIGSIQFVWAQPNPNQLLGLSKLLDNLSNLSPYRDYPYAFSQLLVPFGKSASKNSDKAMIQQSREDAKKLAEKWEMYTCNPEKVAAIKALKEDAFIETFYNDDAKKQYIDPCSTYERAHYAAFNAFYYRKSTEEAANNYKISAFTHGSPGLAPVMAALVYGRGGEHIKSASIRYDRHITLSSQEQNDPIIAKETQSTLQKAVFELQLQLITDADNASNKACKQSYKCLLEKWHIKVSILSSFNDICQKWTSTTNLRCTLLEIWLKNNWIGLNGKLTYPIEWWWEFSWNTDYNSRWIIPKE